MNETEYEFRKGDRVRAKIGAPYGITKEGWIGYVVRSRNRTGLIHVWSNMMSNNGYAVDPKYFDLIDESGNPIIPDPPVLTEISDSEFEAFMKT